jgi:hypothetical protein
MVMKQTQILIQENISLDDKHLNSSTFLSQFWVIYVVVYWPMASGLFAVHPWYEDRMRSIVSLPK